MRRARAALRARALTTARSDRFRRRMRHTQIHMDDHPSVLVCVGVAFRNEPGSAFDGVCELCVVRVYLFRPNRLVLRASGPTDMNGNHTESHTRGCHASPRLALTSVCPLERTSTCADGRPRLLQSRVSTLRQSDCVRRGRSTAAAAPRREARPPLCCPACQRSGRRAAARHAGAALVCVCVCVCVCGACGSNLG